MKITVIGAGNIGTATCVYLLDRGCDVSLFTRDSKKAMHLNLNGIISEGKITGHYNLKAYDCYEEALRNSDYILITTLANDHLDVFKSIQPYLKKGQRIIVFNGNWGAFEAKNYYKEFLAEEKIVVAETSAMLLMGNVSELGRVNILGIKNEVNISTVVPEDVDTVIFELSEIFPQLKKSFNIFETSLSSTNPIIHVPISIFNLARIDEGHDFSFYGQGVSKSTIEYIEAIDHERITLANNLGIFCPNILSSINGFFDIKHDNLYDALNKNQTYISGKAPKKLSHRYLTEDIPYGLVPIVKLGRILGINTEYSEAIVSLASLVMNIDFMKGGVNISKENII